MSEQEIVTPFRLFIGELRALPGCEETKARVLKLVESFATARMYVTMRDTVKPAQAREAVHLLRLGLNRAEVMRRLVAHYGISESTAYRIIDRALTATRPPIEPQPKQEDLFL